MAFDFGQAASGAASGAAAGSSIAPGIGTAVGGVLGGLASGFLGGGSSERERAIDENRDLLEELTAEYREAEATSPTETSFYQTGQAELAEQTERQAEADERAAAAAGLTGSQFAVAQDQNRAQERADALRSLLTDAEQIDRKNEQVALENRMAQRQRLNALITGTPSPAQRSRQSLFNTFSAVSQMEPGDFGFGDSDS
jgi:hypothetical protein